MNINRPNQNYVVTLTPEEVEKMISTDFDDVETYTGIFEELRLTLGFIRHESDKKHYV